MNAKLAGKCALVTGASGGIGQAVAQALAAEGARLVLHYNSNKRAIRALAKKIATPNIVVQADLRSEEAAEAMLAAAEAAFGQVDLLVVNAGIWLAESVPLHEMSLAQWEETLAADLTSAFLTCRAFLRHLARKPRESAGIVLVGSTAALFGEAGHADYAAAKAGMAYGLTLSLKNEIVLLAPKGRVNCVCPGWTLTPMTEQSCGDGQIVDRVTATMPLRKLARPEDVAAAIVFLASDALSGHISGAILPVSGGMEGRLLHVGPVTE